MAALSLWGVALAAQEVTLRSPQGFVVSGEVLGFDGRYIRLAGETGALTLDLTALECSGAACPDPENFVPALRLSGAPRIAEVLMPALIESYARQDGLELTAEGGRFLLSRDASEVLRITLAPNSSEEGFVDLLASQADMVMSLREVSPEERALLREAGLGDLRADGRSRMLAVAGLVPVVSADNPLRQISLADLAAALAGEIEGWSALGGSDAALSLHLRGPRNGFVQGVEALLLEPFGRSLATGFVVHDSDADLVAAVVADPGALGLVSADRAGAAQVLRLTGACGLSVGASDRSLATEDYPLTMPLLLYLPQRRLPEAAADFVDWLDTPAARAVVRRAGFTDLAPTAIPLDAQGERLANAIRQAGEDVTLRELQRMLRRLDGTTRLSTTFRFEAGSTVLDAQSRAALRRFALALEGGRFDGRRIVLAGFSDARGPALENRTLSAARAETLQRRLGEMLGAEVTALIETAGFGEALPMACDDSEVGRQVNRRVEVWVGDAPVLE